MHRALLVMALTLGVAFAAEATLRSEARATLCDKFSTVSDYVVANCSTVEVASLDANCVESFQSFAETPSLLIDCETHESDHHTRQRMVQFMEIYNTWQQNHTCELFHAKEEHAARRCGGAAIQKPWHTEAFPLYCEKIFELYHANRATLDATCPRTQFSDAFWEAYADYIASPLCKTYYKHVRDATAWGCAQSTTGDDDHACEHMFQWYTQHRDRVETDCLEVAGAKPFYKGFYAWKRHQHTT